MTEQHAFLAPSGASIWGPSGCSYYPTMAAKYPREEDTPEAREGTAAHHYLSETLNGRPCAVGDLAPNGHPVTAEMVECAQIMVGWVNNLRPSLDRPLMVEQRVDMPSIHPTLNWGTTDIAGVNIAQKTIYIGDYKHGHRYVDPYENWQLVDYGVGVARAFSLVITPEWKFVFCVVQPRAYHADGPLKIWPCGGGRFMELADSLAYAARKACEPDPMMTTGEHCRDCEGNTRCPAFHRAAGSALDVSERGVPTEITPEAAGTLRTMIEDAQARLKGMATGLDARIEAWTRQGSTVPGWGLKPTVTRLAWTEPMDNVYALGDMFGIDLRKPEAITPTQAIALGIDETVISEYAKRPPGGLKVAPVEKSAAAKAFK